MDVQSSSEITEPTRGKFFARESQFKNLLWLPVFTLTCFGLLAIYSSSSIYSEQKFGYEFLFVKKQLIVLLIAVLSGAIGAKISLDFLLKHSVKFYALFIVCVIATHLPVIGKKVGGAARWLNLGFINFQPSEFLKIFSVIFFAGLLTQEKLPLYKIWPIFLAPLVIITQPDFGTTVVLLSALVTMIFIRGLPIKYFVTLIVGLIPFATIVLLMKSYRLARLTTYLDPFADPLGAGFQIIQSFVAVATGGFFGKGLGESQQKLFFLPEAHTDFILAVISEEMGFLGITAIFILYMILYLCIFRIQIFTQTISDKLIASGFFTFFLMNTVVNMGVVVGALPAKGLPLPFVSYGGTSLLANFFMIGILVQISQRLEREQKKTLKNPDLITAKD